MSVIVRARRPKALLLTSIVAVGAAAFLFPFYWLVIGSSNQSRDFFSRNPTLLPGTELFDNLSGLFGEGLFGRAVVNSVVVSGTAAIGGVLICSAAGYALAKFEFRGRRLLFGVTIAMLALPSQVTLVPLFKMMVTLGWLNTYHALVLPNLALPFAIFMMRQMMQSVPDEILEAGRIDGAGEGRIFFHLVLPMMKPALAALAIFLFLTQWNDFVYPLVVLRSEDSYTIPVALAAMQDLQKTDYGQLFTATLVSVLPILVLFLSLQRQFVAGLTAGAVKQ